MIRNSIMRFAFATVFSIASLIGEFRRRPKKPGSRPRARILSIVVASFSAMLVPCGPALGAEESGGFQPALVVHLDEWVPPPMSDAEALAARVLRREGGGYSLTSAPGSQVVRQLAGALSAIRGLYPETANVEARETYADRKGVILGLDPEVFSSVSRVVESGSSQFELRTGYARFDTLNALLGVRAVDVFPSFESVVFHFDPIIDLDYVAMRYSTLAREVRSVDFDVLLLDGPDIEVSMSLGTWYFVFRDAWGDCPSGCLNVDLHFFTVQAGDAKRVDPVSAMDIPEFAVIRENRGWFHRSIPRESK